MILIQLFDGVMMPFTSSSSLIYYVKNVRQFGSWLILMGSLILVVVLQFYGLHGRRYPYFYLKKKPEKLALTIVNTWDQAVIVLYFDCIYCHDIALSACKY